MAEEENIFNEASHSVQTHLSILQKVVERMATNSASCKAWCIALVSAVLVVVADKGNPNLALLAGVPIILFFTLDAYYLSLERLFRQLFKEFVRKVHERQVVAEDLYTVEPEGVTLKSFFKAAVSFSVWVFYISLAMLIGLAWWVVL